MSLTTSKVKVRFEPGFWSDGSVVTKPQQTNEHIREVINHSTHTHLLHTIKSILTQTLEKLCKKRVYGKKDFDNLYF